MNNSTLIGLRTVSPSIHMNDDKFYPDDTLKIEGFNSFSQKELEQFLLGKPNRNHDEPYIS